MGTVCDTVSRAHHDAWRASRGAQGHNILDRFEHDLRHVLSVGLGVHKSFREQDGVVLKHNPDPVERARHSPCHPSS